MNYTRYFVINLVIEGFFNLLPEKKQVRLSYVILEEKRDTLDGNFFIYTGMCFEGTHIKKSLSAKNVCELISTPHIKFSRCVSKSLTNEEILSIIEDDTSCLIPISTKSKLYSYNI